jgi:hypothetical protein
MTWEELRETLLAYGAKRYDLETLHLDTEKAFLDFVNSQGYIPYATMDSDSEIEVA